MKIEILDVAERDLVDGFHFYERQAVGLGSYFLTNLYEDIESLRQNAGIHSKPYKDFHRLLSKRFPFAIFYKVENETAFVHAILDCRRNPTRVRKRLRES